MSHDHAKGASGEFILRKLHSLTGFFPLCIFLLFHLLANCIAIAGMDKYLWFIEHFDATPGLFILEWVMIFIPLTLHVLMGIWLVLTGRNNPTSYSYGRNWMFFFQRLSAVIIVPFLIWHIYILKFASGGGMGMIYMLQGIAANPITAVCMVIGLIAVSFHVCNGLWGFCINWGITPGKRAQAVWSKVTFVLFLGLSALWILIFASFM